MPDIGVSAVQHCSSLNDHTPSPLPLVDGTGVAVATRASQPRVITKPEPRLCVQRVKSCKYNIM